MYGEKAKRLVIKVRLFEYLYDKAFQLLATYLQVELYSLIPAPLVKSL
jgi:hypothetical protein